MNGEDGPQAGIKQAPPSAPAIRTGTAATRASVSMVGMVMACSSKGRECRLGHPIVAGGTGFIHPHALAVTCLFLQSLRLKPPRMR